LKYLFHKTSPVGGNDNTVCVAHLKVSDNKDSPVIVSTAAANLKMLISLAKEPKDDQSLISIDTGMNGNPFQGNYFDLNKDHLEGRLKPLKWRPQDLEGTRFNTLTIQPKVSKKNATND